jgi:hypothetical protein
LPELLIDRESQEGHSKKEYQRMTTKERLLAEIDHLSEQDLEELYALAVSFAQSREAGNRSESIMSKLRRIKIHGPRDFATNLDLYLSGEKRDESNLP